MTLSFSLTTTDIIKLTTSAHCQAILKRFDELKLEAHNHAMPRVPIILRNIVVSASASPTVLRLGQGYYRQRARRWAETLTRLPGCKFVVLRGSSSHSIRPGASDLDFIVVVSDSLDQTLLRKLRRQVRQVFKERGKFSLVHELFVVSESTWRYIIEKLPQILGGSSFRRYQSDTWQPLEIPNLPAPKSVSARRVKEAFATAQYQLIQKKSGAYSEARRQRAFDKLFHELNQPLRRVRSRSDMTSALYEASHIIEQDFPIENNVPVRQTSHEDCNDSLELFWKSKLELIAPIELGVEFGTMLFRVTRDLDKFAGLLEAWSVCASKWSRYLRASLVPRNLGFAIYPTHNVFSCANFENPDQELEYRLLEVFVGLGYEYITENKKMLRIMKDHLRATLGDKIAMHPLSHDLHWFADE